MSRAPTPTWYPDTFERLVDRYVYKRFVTTRFRDAVSKIDKKKALSEFEGFELIKILFEDSKEIKQIYQSPENLIFCLNTIQHFPDNSKFLGFPDGQFNYLAIPIVMPDTRGNMFIGKMDYFVYIYSRLIVPLEEPILLLISQSIGNKLYRKLKDSYELVPNDDFFSKKTRIANMVIFDSMNRKSERFPDQQNMSFDEIFQLFADSYDKEHDGELMNELKQLLQSGYKLCSLPQNTKFRELYTLQSHWKSVLERYFELVTAQPSEHHWFNVKYPTVRFFEDDKLNERKFMMAKELENALEIVLRKKYQKPFPKGLFTVETTEERKIGIIRVVEWETFQTILKILKVTIYDLHMIEQPFEQTTRQTPVPLNTPYGTYCTLARHAFCDVFDHIVVGMRLFQAVNKENSRKVFDWFAQFNDVFSDERTHRYFIENWKIDEIVERAYKELQQYATETVFQLPERPRILMRRDVLKQLYKFAPKFSYQSSLRNAYTSFLPIHADNSKYVDTCTVQDIYESAIKNTFLDHNPKYLKFLEHQGIKKYFSFANETTNEDVNKIVKLSEYAEKYKSAVMVTLPKIPYDKFIPRDQMEKWIMEELDGYRFDGMALTTEMKEYFEIGQLFAKYLDTEEIDGKLCVKRRTRPLKMSEKLMEALSNDKEFCDILSSQAAEFANTEDTDEKGLQSRTENFFNEVMKKKLSEMFKQKAETDENGDQLYAELANLFNPAPKKDAVSLAELMEIMKLGR